MFIRSERLFLRPPFPEDWRELHREISDPAVVHMLSNVPWPYRESDALEFATRDERRHLPHRLICLPGPTGAPIVGCVGLEQVGDDVELGYWISRPCWGRGFATEAVRSFLTLAAVLGHRRIHAVHAEGNVASAKVLHKLGFQATGENVERFSKAYGKRLVVRRHVLDLTKIADFHLDSLLPAAA